MSMVQKERQAEGKKTKKLYFPFHSAVDRDKLMTASTPRRLGKFNRWITDPQWKLHVS